MIIKIEDIIIDERIRKDKGDIELLAASIKKHGLLNWPIISADNHLIAGERRVRAAQLLNWDEISVHMTTSDYSKYRAVELEIAENVDRKDFSRSERVYCGMVLEEHERVEAEKRMKAGKSGDPRDNLPRGKVRDIVAKRLGISGTTYDHEKFIVEHRGELSEKVFSAWDKGEASTNKVYIMLTKSAGGETLSSRRKSSVEEPLMEGSQKNSMKIDNSGLLDDDIEQMIDDFYERLYKMMLQYGIRVEFADSCPESPFSGTISFFVCWNGVPNIFSEVQKSEICFSQVETPTEITLITVPPIWRDSFLVAYRDAIYYVRNLFRSKVGEARAGFRNFESSFGSNSENPDPDDITYDDNDSHACPVKASDIPDSFVKMIMRQVIKKYAESDELGSYATALFSFLKQQDWKDA